MFLCRSSILLLLLLSASNAHYSAYSPGSHEADFLASRNQTTNLRFQIISDTHLESKPPESVIIIPHADHLVLVGDISSLEKDAQLQRYKEFLLVQANRFKKVFVILGNHEYYGGIYEDVHAKAEAICNLHPNLQLLDRTSILFEGRRILGATLWSHIPESKVSEIKGMYKSIERISLMDPKTNKKRKAHIRDASRWHERDLAWLKAEITKAKENHEEVIVFTHYSPILDGSDPKYASSPINFAFNSDLEYLLGDPIKLWVYGHTHYSQDIVRKGTRIVSNCLGYPRELPTETRFVHDAVVEV
eukprot:TRINITY_DN8979_c0_g1_i1.p1 TRINITY_DN8979_c0_g1~~TRINITY_DN8979_c0_g1_i1.p1  ORF type:complete len:303 (+),score=33.22 TRINITY_DN8979_c0_g1_i1:106-1014(+)